MVLKMGGIKEIQNTVVSQVTPILMKLEGLGGLHPTKNSSDNFLE